MDELPVLIADVKNEESLKDMCSQTQVLLNCVGPVSQLGSVLQTLEAFISGCHTCNIWQEIKNEMVTFGKLLTYKTAQMIFMINVTTFTIYTCTIILIASFACMSVCITQHLTWHVVI